ncbi:sensor histidine kinase [Evtepia sp.]|uniref:sensor histidine kinase n=1 Tax=Evtepia sp. TaxID=2773933 RepID=UPI003F167D34
MALFFRYLNARRRVLLAWGLFVLCFLISFLLYHLPVGAVLYPAGLCLLLGGLLTALDFRRVCRDHRRLLELQALPPNLTDDLPEPDGIGQEDYQALIDLLCRRQQETETQLSARFEDMVDYYTAWAHQIKTPIASMRLHLQNEDSPLARQLTGDLGRIEQYVEMALVYLRLDADSTDYVIGEYDLDAIVRGSVRRFAGEFIGRRLRLDYTPLETTVLTDEKWLSFVVEQVLSNALKYTRVGGVAIFLEEPKTLCIRDTGIGIAPEDLPRIFEKGYTGVNGRRDKGASGLGLYLCRRICQNLGHTITAQSIPDEGTVIRIDLSRRELRLE